MRIISKKRLQDFWRNHPDAKEPLLRWYAVVQSTEWKNLAELRRTFPSADSVGVASGNTVLVFNIAGNKFRLVGKPHFNRNRFFVLRILTHRQYDRLPWKDKL